MDHSTIYLVRQRWQGIKDNDRNFVAAFFHMCTVALVCTSLAALGWFRLRGAPCSPHLAVYQFFSYGHFSMDSNPSIPEIVSSKAVSSPLISQYHSSTGGTFKFTIFLSRRAFNRVCLDLDLKKPTAKSGFFSRIVGFYGPQILERKIRKIGQIRRNFTSRTLSLGKVNF